MKSVIAKISVNFKKLPGLLCSSSGRHFPTLETEGLKTFREVLQYHQKSVWFYKWRKCGRQSNVMRKCNVNDETQATGLI